VSSLRNLLCAAAAVGLLFSSSTAEARFGKRSNSSDSEKKEKKEKKQDKDDDDDDEKQSSGRVHDATAVDTSERTHDASPVGSRRPPPPPRDSGPGTVVIVEQPPPVYYVAPPPAYVAPAPEVSLLTPPKDTVYNPMRLALGGGPLGGGVGIDLMLTFEGEQMGLDGRLLGLTLPTDDGSGGTDGITVAQLHLTYALLAQDRVRWRVEGGFTTARAPEITFVGPSVATSLDARLLPTLDFESRLQVTPFPYRQIDAQAGLSFEPYPWAIRAGWRALMLDDAGLLDGEVHRDFFNGPFISFGLFL